MGLYCLGIIINLAVPAQAQDEATLQGIIIRIIIGKTGKANTDYMQIIYMMVSCDFYHLHFQNWTKVVIVYDHVFSVAEWKNVEKDLTKGEEDFLFLKTILIV